MQVRESTIGQKLIEKLGELKYTLRPDIRDRAAMERNFREKFEALNRVSLTNIRAGYRQFKADKAAKDMAALSGKHGLPVAAMQAFVDGILARRIFDGEQLTELLAPLDLGWKARTQKELALMGDLLPLLKRRAGGREIAGLRAYEQ